MGETLQNILFPAPVPYREGGKLFISYDAYDNLSGALLDIENAGGKCDAGTMATLYRIHEQLREARRCTEQVKIAEE